MKLIMMVSIVLSYAMSAWAHEPIVTKSNQSGFTPPEWVRVEVCRLYLDRVEINRTLGSASIAETRSVAVTNIAEVVAAAAGETLQVTPNLICDAPTTFIQAHMEDGSDIVLFFSGGCGQPRQERVGSQTAILVDMINSYCPTTHDFQ